MTACGHYGLQIGFSFALYCAASDQACFAGPTMLRSLLAIVVMLFAGVGASAQTASYASPGQAMPMTPPLVVTAPPPPPMRSNLGGGFIEFLFGNRGPQPRVAEPPPNLYPQPVPRPVYANAPATDAMVEEPPQGPPMDPKYRRQVAHVPASGAVSVACCVQTPPERTNTYAEPTLVPPALSSP